MNEDIDIKIVFIEMIKFVSSLTWLNDKMYYL